MTLRSTTLIMRLFIQYEVEGHSIIKFIYFIYKRKETCFLFIVLKCLGNAFKESGIKKNN